MREHGTARIPSIRSASHLSDSGILLTFVLRKEGNVYVHDLFVKVPSGAVAPSKYKPMEVDAIHRVADGREQRKRVTFDCTNPTF